MNRFQNRFIKFIRKNIAGWLLVSPLVVGLLVFTLYPLLTSLYYSFFSYNMITPPKDFGFHNYSSVLWGGESTRFWNSIKNTLTYIFCSIPLSMVLSYLLALMLHRPTVTSQVFRIIYYIPTLIPAVVTSLVWNQILDVDYGIINVFLRDYLGVKPFNFFSVDNLMITFIMMQTFTIGGGMVIWISSFNGIPDSLYEAARLDGANAFSCFFHITLPMSTPAIFYNYIMGLIGGFQTFATPYALTGGTGGAGEKLLTIVMHIYNKAFMQFNFGVAMSMSWCLFAIIAILTAISFKAQKWVYYGEEA